jgi:hypothetical protein
MTLTISEIIEAVAYRFEVSPADVAGYSRQARYVRPRFAVAYLSRMAGHSLNAIGQALNRDHTSIIHGDNRAQELVLNCQRFSQVIVQLRAALIDAPIYERKPIFASCRKVSMMEPSSGNMEKLNMHDLSE